MFKILPFILIGSFAVHGAQDHADDLGSTKSGTISTSGVTFATQEYLDEALKRGLGDDRNPFVGNVCEIFYSTPSGMVSATITQVAKGVFLACKHTSDELNNAYNEFSKANKQFALGLITTNNEFLLGATKMAISPHPTADIALMGLCFTSGSIPACDFLPIAEPMNEKKANGFMVSYTHASVLGKKEPESESPFDGKRVLSVHDFTKEQEGFMSTLPGNVPAEKEGEMLKAAVTFYVDPTEQARSELKNVLKTAVFNFTDKHRLMCTTGTGVSGSPLVVKQGGAYKIMGLLNKGAPFPKMLLDGIIQKGNRQVEYRNSFVDVTLYRDWILPNISALKNELARS